MPGGYGYGGYQSGPPPPQNHGGYGYGQAPPPPQQRPAGYEPGSEYFSPADESEKSRLRSLYYDAVTAHMSDDEKKKVSMDHVIAYYKLSAKQLQSVLVNGDHSEFDPDTIRLMMRMFDLDRSGSISFDEFRELWKFLLAWGRLFNHFDKDSSRRIDCEEFNRAVAEFGYRLSREFVTFLFRTFDRNRKGTMSFDLFVQAFCQLKILTDIFRKHDTDRDGYVTLSL